MMNNRQLFEDKIKYFTDRDKFLEFRFFVKIILIINI